MKLIGVAMGRLESNNFKNYVELASIGLELFIPIGLGVFLDTYWDTKPWFTLAGIGLGAGLAGIHIAKSFKS